MLLEEIAQVVRRVVKDPRTQGVTLTEVRLSADLRHARVYYSVLGDDRRQEEARKGLTSARGVIRREIGRHLRLRYVPDIEFFFDPSFDHADRIERLLRQIHRAEE